MSARAWMLIVALLASAGPVSAQEAEPAWVIGQPGLPCGYEQEPRPGPTVYRVEESPKSKASKSKRRQARKLQGAR